MIAETDNRQMEWVKLHEQLSRVASRGSLVRDTDSSTMLIAHIVNDRVTTISNPRAGGCFAQEVIPLWRQKLRNRLLSTRKAQWVGQHTDVLAKIAVRTTGASRIYNAREDTVDWIGKNPHTTSGTMGGANQKGAKTKIAEIQISEGVTKAYKLASTNATKSPSLHANLRRRKTSASVTHSLSLPLPTTRATSVIFRILKLCQLP